MNGRDARRLALDRSFPNIRLASAHSGMVFSDALLEESKSGQPKLVPQAPGLNLFPNLNCILLAQPLVHYQKSEQPTFTPKEEH